MSTEDIDDYDRKILEIIQVDAELPASTIAEVVNLSASAVQRRIKRLKDLGVIVATVAVVDGKKVGRPLVFLAAVEVERERKDLLNQLKKWLLGESYVQQAFYTTGASDLTVIITAKDVEEYDHITQMMVEMNPNIKRINTSVCLQIYKRGSIIPTD
ncbi:MULTISPECIES: Lrp/AsnC family transcriptional regulator [Mesorhizobium]|uniref:AsnC family transcriptional regulator n=1 Tax=Rhizobium loti TaxID=381 RepID=A0A8E2W800_RHILI|nr:MULTISPECIES: Lrp/AsnC family transcriptional regulator [Mesorhizobium]PWJ88165.1 AsnC family transcriptional regulator [Mesorhizobium loti]QKC86864.1 Lrp/AsnC family transcriptional regulator [Mesorhizobium sp. NZP2077]QKD20569.1 Lrp/AsnC family transcriptional regulator [Mesorhizobium sp. NZP2077]